MRDPFALERRQSKDGGTVQGHDMTLLQVLLVMMDDIAYDHISYLIQRSTLLMNKPTAPSILAVHTMETSVGVYTIISHRLTF